LSRNMNKAVFLDRDGTLIVDKLYLGDPNGVEVKEEMAEAARRLKEGGYLLVVISNQSGIGRGFFTREAVDAVNGRMIEEYRSRGIEIDEVLYCPHNPESVECECRKPKPKLFFDAARRLDIDIAASAMIGDRATDPEAGLAAGCGMNILLAEKPSPGLSPEIVVVRDMPAAADAILKWGSGN